MLPVAAVSYRSNAPDDWQSKRRRDDVRLFPLQGVWILSRGHEAADIDYRGVTLNFGKFRFRKLPGERIEFRTPLRGLFVWDEVDTEELLAFLMNVRDQMRKFQRRPATIQWK